MHQTICNIEAADHAQCTHANADASPQSDGAEANWSVRAASFDLGQMQSVITLCVNHRGAHSQS